MKKSKLKLGRLKIKSFLTTPKNVLELKSKGTDGGYTWVG